LLDVHILHEGTLYCTLCVCVWLHYTKRIAFYCETVPQYVVQDTSCVL